MRKDFVKDPKGFTSRTGGKFSGWRVTPRGIEIRNTDGQVSPVQRTPGEPVTARRVVLALRDYVSGALEEVKASGPLPCSDDQAKALVFAMILTESRGVPGAREEPRINDWSFGVCQTLTATAAAEMRGLKKAGVAFQDIDVPAPFPTSHTLRTRQWWQDFLTQEKNSVLVGTSFILRNAKTWGVSGEEFDPVLAYASYNSGGVYTSEKNQMGLRYYGEAMNNFMKWFGDVCSLKGELW